MPPRTRRRFIGFTQQAIQGELNGRAGVPQTAPALMLLLDQWPLQIWRANAMAFAGDSQALALSLRAVELGWLEAEPEPSNLWRDCGAGGKGQLLLYSGMD